MPILLGAIADDFTGATDLCNTLVKEGMRTVQTIGVPPAGLAIPEADAVVVALKSRTCPPSEAVALSLEALAWLRAAGARQILFKYCSTFDSTEKGNIGPVGDALLEALDAGLTIACPAFPETGRTIYRGHLFVGDALLSDTHMRDHPLTPMRDSNLVRLLARQSRHEVGPRALGHDRPRCGCRAGDGWPRSPSRRLPLRRHRCAGGRASAHAGGGVQRAEADHRRLGDSARACPPTSGRRGCSQGRREPGRAAGGRGPVGRAQRLVLGRDAGAGGGDGEASGRRASSTRWPSRPRRSRRRSPGPRVDCARGRC